MLPPKSTSRKKRSNFIRIIESYEYAHDSNRLLSVAQQQGGDSQTRQLGYDAVGNIIKDSRAQDANLALIYGANNRLQQVEQGMGGASGAVYTYNSKGQRVSKRVVLSDGHVQVIHFHYDMADRLLAETDAQGQVLKEYVYAGAERVAMVDYQQGGEEAGLLFVHNDHLGTPQLMTSMEREVVWRSEVLPFGQALAEANLESMKLGFPGQYWDGETGFRYNYFRDYDAGLGRYVQSDPIGLGGGVNTFGYVSGSPLNSIDVYGLAGQAALAACAGGPVACALGIGVAAYGTYKAYEVGQILVNNGYPNLSTNMFAKPGNQSRPKNAPSGTKPIDKLGLSRPDIHDIKDGIGAAPNDWTGITPDGDVITSNPDGSAENHGPADDYTQSPTGLCE